MATDTAAIPCYHCSLSNLSSKIEEPFYVIPQSLAFSIPLSSSLLSPSLSA